MDDLIPMTVNPSELTSSWRIVAAATAGAAHRRDGGECQDFFHTEFLKTAEGDELLLLIVCDGAGSASYGRRGAELTCEFMTESIKVFFSNHSDLISLGREQFADWIVLLRDWIDRFAELNHHNRRDYATTLTLAVVGSSAGIFVQLGDGAAVFRGADEWQIAVWPQHGEFANSTYFVTDEDSHLRFEMVEVDELIIEVALLTDGLERLALHHQSRRIHQSFFDEFFVPVRSLAQYGFDRGLSAGLGHYLQTPTITSRSDDDCSLVLASRG